MLSEITDRRQLNGCAAFESATLEHGRIGVPHYIRNAPVDAEYSIEKRDLHQLQTQRPGHECSSARYAPPFRNYLRRAG